MPQELHVWYILPALRREFAKCFVDAGLTQKETSVLMQVTEAAVSQYMKSKRAAGIKFSPDVKSMVNDSCSRVIAGESGVAEELYSISISDAIKDTMCQVHKLHDSSVSAGCNICFK
ncbi:transcriptional regulator [Nanoarchaeota archaeon]